MDITTTGDLNIPNEQTDRRLLRDGFVAMVPLWSGAIPTGIAFAVAAHNTGLSFIEIQAMSLTVFSAGAQLAALAVVADSPSIGAYALVVVTINIHLVLLGVVAGRSNRLSHWRKVLVATFLTDSSFAISAREGVIRWQVLLGAGLSMYVGWNIGTLMGALAGGAASRLPSEQLALVAPLTFLAVLAPVIRTSPALVTLLAAGATMLLLTGTVPVGVALLAAAVIGSAAGSWWDARVRDRVVAG